MLSTTARRLAPIAPFVPLFSALPTVAQPITEDFMLTASDAALSDEFGQSVAVCGSTAIVGAVGVDRSTNAAYVFDTATGQQLFKLSASDAAAGDSFGWSVAISETTAIFGAPIHSGGAGNSSGGATALSCPTAATSPVPDPPRYRSSSSRATKRSTTARSATRSRS